MGWATVFMLVIKRVGTGRPPYDLSNVGWAPRAHRCMKTDGHEATEFVFGPYKRQNSAVATISLY